MLYTPKIISQTVTLNPLPVMSRGTAATNMDYFLEMKNYVIMWTDATINVMFLYKKVDGILKYISTLPCQSSLIPMPLGDNDAFVTKDYKNCSVTINFIDPETDEVTQLNVCVSTTTDNTGATYSIDTIDNVIYLLAMEGAADFLYTGTVNMTAKTVNFVKKTIATCTPGATGATAVTTFFMITPTVFCAATTHVGVACANGAYSISGSTITKYAAGSSSYNFLPQPSSVLGNINFHVPNGVYFIKNYNTLVYVDVTIASTSATIKTIVTSTNNVAVIHVPGSVIKEKFVNMNFVDGFYYKLKDSGAFDILTTNNLITQSGAINNVSGVSKYGPIINDILLVLDQCNQYNYMPVPIKFENNIISSANKQIDVYTNTSGSTQLLTGIAITALAHVINSAYYNITQTLAIKNCIGVAINGKTLFRATFDHSYMQTLANCPIPLQPNDVVSLDVANSFGDITLTLFGILHPAIAPNY